MCTESSAFQSKDDLSSGWQENPPGLWFLFILREGFESTATWGVLASEGCVCNKSISSMASIESVVKGPRRLSAGAVGVIKWLIRVVSCFFQRNAVTQRQLEVISWELSVNFVFIYGDLMYNGRPLTKVDISSGRCMTNAQIYVLFLDHIIFQSHIIKFTYVFRLARIPNFNKSFNSSQTFSFNLISEKS